MANNAPPLGPAPGPPAGPDSAAIICWNFQCRRSMRVLQHGLQQLHDSNNDLTQRLGQHEARVREQANRIRELEAEKEALELKLARQGKHTERTWPEMLRLHLQAPRDGMSYDKIYRLSCKEENMSSKTEWVHPDIKLVAPPDQHDDARSVAESAGANPDVAPDQVAPCEPSIEQPFPFEGLPGPLQVKVLTLLLHKKGQLIHCMSRLDPFVEPESFPSAEELGDLRSGLKKRFIWGKRECSLTHDGVDPNDLLGILTVSKQMHFLGVHVFYGLNTFAFSSLGELGRFCQGSGLARIGRIQHIELLLTGNQFLTAPLDERKKIPFSRRTYALTWLADMYQLKTLVVHVNETAAMYTRRGYENPRIKNFLTAKSAGQPNQRMLRSLRCLQGLDYIYQLRGLTWIRFYDFNKALKAKRSVHVHVQDWSFREDVYNTTTLPKPPKRLERSQLENLEPLLPGQNQNWMPTYDDWALAKSIFENTNGHYSYDELRHRRRHRDADLGSYLGGPGGSTHREESPPGFGSDVDSDTSSGSYSDSDGSPVADQPRRRRQTQRSPSPLFVSDADAEDGDSDSDLDSTSSSTSSADDSEGTDSVSRSASGSDSGSDSDSSSASGSRRSFTSILSRHHTSTAPSAGNINTTASPHPRVRRRPNPRDAKRESTGLFVTPGPRASPAIKHARDTPAGTHVKGEDEENGAYGVQRALRASGHGGVRQRRPPVPVPSWARVVDLTVDDDDNDNNNGGDSTGSGVGGGGGGGGSGGWENGAQEGAFRPLESIFEGEEDDGDEGGSESGAESDSDSEGEPLEDARGLFGSEPGSEPEDGDGGEVEAEGEADDGMAFEQRIMQALAADSDMGGAEDGGSGVRLGIRGGLKRVRGSDSGDGSTGRKRRRRDD